MPSVVVEPNDAESGEPFVDADFPHTVESIGEIYAKRLTKKTVVWRRLSDKSYWPLRPCKLFDDQAPCDLKQGSLGNCWLVSQIAALGEFDVWLKERIFQTKELSPDGKYVICLFSIEEKEWKPIVVDEFVPCYKVNPVHLGSSWLFNWCLETITFKFFCIRRISKKLQHFGVLWVLRCFRLLVLVVNGAGSSHGGRSFPLEFPWIPNVLA